VRVTDGDEGGPGANLGLLAARALAELGGSAFGPGLTAAEFERIEAEYGIEFADDHRAFLAAGLPLNVPQPQEPGVFYTHAAPWPDWRDGDPAALRSALGWPVEGVLFDVEHGHWDPRWGARPDDPSSALALAASQLALVPRMIPVYGHRYLPGGRGSFGHPVLSMYQTDIICYGADLLDYIHHEFGAPSAVYSDPLWRPPVTVPYWREFV
jgi:hypothetical protein